MVARSLILPLLLLLLGSAKAQEPVVETDAEIWGGLLYAVGPDTDAADQDSEPSGIDATALADLQKRLAIVFGDDKTYHLVGEHTQGLFKQYESWLVPSKELFLKLDSKGPADGGGVNLNLQLWQEKKVIMKTDATLRPGSPLFIEGPKWRDGNLVFVVLLPKNG